MLIIRGTRTIWRLLISLPTDAGFPGTKNCSKPSAGSGEAPGPAGGGGRRRKVSAHEVTRQWRSARSKVTTGRRQAAAGRRRAGAESGGWSLPAGPAWEVSRAVQAAALLLSPLSSLLTSMTLLDPGSWPGVYRWEQGNFTASTENIYFHDSITVHYLS